MSILIFEKNIGPKKIGTMHKKHLLFLCIVPQRKSQGQTALTFLILIIDSENADNTVDGHAIVCDIIRDMLIDIDDGVRKIALRCVLHVLDIEPFASNFRRDRGDHCGDVLVKDADS